jgi:hypothetical protein
MPRLRYQCAVLAALAASGCAVSPPAPKADRFVATKACADSPAELPRIRLKIQSEKQKPIELVVDGSSECLRDARGVPRPAVLFVLEDAPSAQIDVTTFGYANITLAAKVSLLDARLEPLSQYDFSRFAKRGPDYSLALFLNPGRQPQPKFLLVTADDAWLGQKNQVIAGERTTFVWSTGVVTGVYSDGNERNTTSTFSDAGRIRLDMRSYAPPAISQPH